MYSNQTVEFDQVLAPSDLQRVIIGLRKELDSSRDPVCAYLVGQVLVNFKGVLSKQFFEGLDIFADECFYFRLAFDRFHRDAIEGNPGAARWISQFYLNGTPPVSVDMDKYWEWLTKAAQSGDPISKAELADKASPY